MIATLPEYADLVSRESKAVGFWLLVLVLAAGGWWWYERSRPADPDAMPPGSRPADAQQVKVNFLLDGDSLEVSALAPGATLPTIDPVQVRLLGIDAPEVHGGPDGQPQCWAEQARAELHQLAPAGGSLWVRADRQLKDKYDRYLLYAWTADGTFVNAALAGRGAVRELSIFPNREYESLIYEQIEQARTAERGLWSACQ